jgi:homoserine O-acetyltransferase
MSSQIARNVREGVLSLGKPFCLHHGGQIASLDIAWRCEGDSVHPVVVALGGISAHRVVCDQRDAAAGWWSTVVGPGAPIPTDRYQILSFDYLGGSGDTTGPKDSLAFPSVSTFDQAELLHLVLRHLEIQSIHAFVGASYGGMVGLAFADRYPQRLQRLIVLSAAHRTHPMATAWRSVQRRIVRLGDRLGDTRSALALARALAMSTYRTPEEFLQRFDGEARHNPEGAVFPVEEYLMARGEQYAVRYAAGSFVALSESIDLHRVDPRQISVPVSALAVDSDQLVPLADMQQLAASLPQCRLTQIHSIFGHDAFLKEAQQLRPFFEQSLR